MKNIDQIIKGEISYTFDDLAQNVKGLANDIGKRMMIENKDEKFFHLLLLFIMFVAEEKSNAEIHSVLKIPDELIEELKEKFKEEIDLARAVHMRCILDMMEQYSVGRSQTLHLVNLKIQEFLKRYIPKDHEYQS